jgi:hypothetical protein
MMSPGTSRMSALAWATRWVHVLIFRNQVIAACGNGSLRLFDLTLEVRERFDLSGRILKRSRACPSEHGTNIPQRSCL